MQRYTKRLYHAQRARENWGTNSIGFLLSIELLLDSIKSACLFRVAIDLPKNRQADGRDLPLSLLQHEVITDNAPIARFIAYWLRKRREKVPGWITELALGGSG
jgi:hypothetical protein